MLAAEDIKTDKGSYGELLGELKDRIRVAQTTALRAVNKELAALYWGIGHRIDERQQTEGWGKGLMEALSKDLPNLQPLAGDFAWRQE